MPTTERIRRRHAPPSPKALLEEATAFRRHFKLPPGEADWDWLNDLTKDLDLAAEKLAEKALELSPNEQLRRSRDFEQTRVPF